MLSGLRRLGLEVKDLDATRAFYEDRLGLQAAPGSASESHVLYDVGASASGAAVEGADADPTSLVLRRPTAQPRGGVHTHYAFATTRAAYPRWRRRLADLDPVEFSFGSSDSLYVYDPAGHCVEIGGIHDTAAGEDNTEAAAVENDTDDVPPLTGVFEVVLEVTDLSRAEARYRRLGFEVVDRGETRRRVRLTGPVDLELWEPQLGIADARGGLHVDLAFTTGDAAAAVEAGAPWAVGPTDVEEGVRVVDDDGHVLTFVPPQSGE
ncbi:MULTISPECIES: fosmidomycin resistance protein [Halobellus]|uniref:fosmidomycin resistance protein n=1 Tax=Halobellus TaxID=1073986 RepID=UPI00210D924D|nr:MULTISPECIES: fosmidomycin resistance protein [Halobellus]MDQ2055115.1 fosmidomycin resistance protein [Halobellus sp. H-GB7]